MTNDTPAADKIVIPELVTNIRTADGFEFLYQPPERLTYHTPLPRHGPACPGDLSRYSPGTGGPDTPGHDGEAQSQRFGRLVLPGIAVTYAVRDPRFMREDDGGGALRPAISCHGRGYRTDRNNEWPPAIPANWHVSPLS